MTDADRPAVAEDGFAATLRGVGPAGLAVALLIVLPGAVTLPGFWTIPISALLVLGWAAASRTPLSALGLAWNRRAPALIVVGLALGVALKLAMKALVMPLMGADPVNHAYHALAHNTAALPGAIFSMIVAAGFGEELIFRGFAFERLGRLIGTRSWGKAAAVALTTVGFAAAHYAGQGLAGVQQAAVTGLVFGSLYALTGRLWLTAAMHAAFDLTALALIYFDLERAVAQSLFG
jgi:membrane protease YdiL (CAAX protease family)